MSTITKDLGAVTAYAYAKEKGYTGTEEEFATLMASYATIAEEAAESAESASQSAESASASASTATQKASEASTAAQTATAKAEETQADADAAALDASQALSAASTATTKATEATTAAATAVSAKDDAVAANTAAQSAKTAAQTAQTGAETAAASVQSSAAQIATNAEDISQLKSEFTALTSDGVVPSAEQILTDKGITDSVPYNYRKTGGDGADRLYDQIVGGSLAVNQLARSLSSFVSQNATIAVSDGVATLTASGSVTYVGLADSGPSVISPIGGHKYLMTAKINGPNNSRIYFSYGNSIALSGYTAGDVWKEISGILTQVSPTGQYIQLRVFASFAVADVVSIKDLMVIDLTLMFGTTIADYIYQLEQTTAGAGVAFFKALFPNDYYPYNAGELVSVSGLSEHKTVGFNQWDEEWESGLIDGRVPEVALHSKNFCKILPNTTYYATCGKTDSGRQNRYYLRILFYDASKNLISSGYYNNLTFTTPENAAYFKIETNTSTVIYGNVYNHDICINISDPAKNGTYEPYKAHSYPLDSTLTLRGLFKLDANNNLYADGDTYDADGKVTRNTILRAYQSGDESLANAITDGTNTVVYSANASTEQADHYQHLQQCDPNGTEEYVSTGIVPVGHNSFYPENLRAKVEQLPWNFASLIAPTESTFTATRNYTTGSLFIVNNVLYKATSNIANGGTITPSTNCTATTLAEIISALA